MELIKRETSPTTIGGIIKTYRKKKKLKQGYLANGLGVTRQQISNYEKGISQISVERFINVMWLLGVDVELHLLEELDQ